MNIVEFTLNPLGIPDVPVAGTKEGCLAVFRSSALKMRPGAVDPGDSNATRGVLTGLQGAALRLDFNLPALVGNRKGADEILKYIPDDVRKVPRW